MSVYKKDTAEHLRQSIESMLAQSVPCEQFVVVQDGPLGEDLCAVINEYAEAQPTVFTVVPLSENIGLGKALDVGLTYCRNDLVARMDADDISLPERCEKLIELFEAEPKLGIAGTNIDEFYDDPTNVVSSRVVPSDYEGIRKFIRRRSPFNHPTVMFRRSEVERCGGYGKMRRKQDFDLFARMIGMGVYARNIDESLLLFRVDAGNYKRRKSWEYVSSYIVVQKENYKRGYCSLWDLIVGAGGQMVMFLTPLFIMKWLSDHLLRKKPAKPAVTEGDKKDEETLVSKHEVKGLVEDKNRYPQFSLKKKVKRFAEKVFRFMPDKLFLSVRYFLAFHRRMDWKDPQTLNEKLQWLKLHDRKDIYSSLVDKYEVRRHIADEIGEPYLIPLVGGPWDSFDQIDFSALPDQFVLKCTHDSGGIVICTNKNTLDMNKTRRVMEMCLKHNFFFGGREWPYKNVKPRIIAEKYMVDESGAADLTDYKFFCFDGKVDCVMVCLDRSTGDTKFYFFDEAWELKRLNVPGKNAPDGFVLPKPKCMDEMFLIAAKLSKGRAFVRVDLYQSSDRIYFGEMTFFPASGFDKDISLETDIYFGKQITLPKND